MGFFAQIASLLIGFVRGLVAAHYNDWRKARKRHRQIATALVYDMRRVLEGLKELVQSMEGTGSIFYMSAFKTCSPRVRQIWPN